MTFSFMAYIIKQILYNLLSESDFLGDQLF